MKTFTVHGPFKIQTDDKFVDRLEARAFWLQDTTRTLAERKGVYVLAVRAGKGITPIYAGKATKTFKQEALGLHQRDALNKGLTKYTKGTPIVFLLIYPLSRGRANLKLIDELESMIIRAGLRANPRLENVRKTKERAWKINGFDLRVDLRAAGKGRRSAAMLAFAKMMRPAASRASKGA